MKLARRFYLYIGIIFLLGIIGFTYLIHVENKRLFVELGAGLSSKGYGAILAGHGRYMLLYAMVIFAFISTAVFLLFHSSVFRPLKVLGEDLRDVNAAMGDEGQSPVPLDGFEGIREAFRFMRERFHKTTSDLEDSMLKYSTLLETTSDAVILVESKEMKVREANRAACHLTGYRESELLGALTPALYGPDEESARYRGFFKRWVYDGKGFMQNGCIRDKNQGIVAVEVAASALELGGRAFVLEVWRDISDRKYLEDKLRQEIDVLERRVGERTEELEDALQRLKLSEQKMIQSTKLISLGEMGAGIAHELNSPLAGILTIVEVLLGRVDSEDRNYALLLKIKDAAVRSKYIIMDMLSYARPFKDEREPIDMNDLVRSTLSLFISEINAADLEIRCDLQSSLPMVPGARGQLMEVIFNIIKNARDALDGRGSISLSTSPAQQGGVRGVAVEIRDRGPGIPARVLERVFDPFFSTKDKGGGLNIGLGLSISDSIIKEHGGAISAENLAGGGACFRVFLPAIGEGGEKKDAAVRVEDEEERGQIPD